MEQQNETFATCSRKNGSVSDLGLQFLDALKSVSFQVSFVLQLSLHHLNVLLDLLLSDRLQLTSSFLFLSQLLQLVVPLFQVCMLHTQAHAVSHELGLAR